MGADDLVFSTYLMATAISLGYLEIFSLLSWYHFNIPFQVTIDTANISYFTDFV